MREGRFTRGRGAVPADDQAAWWFVWRGRELLLVGAPPAEDGEGEWRVPRGTRAELGLVAPEQALVTGYLDGAPCVTGMAPADAALPAGMVGRDLFRLNGLVDEQTSALASYTYQIAYWQETSGYCPRCGHGATLNEVDWGRTCAACGHIGYPRVSPCAIVLIHDGEDRVLLGRQAAWPAGQYSLIAGFVEPAESLEECAAREVREETGVEVDTISYAGSQPWSFPHQLMVGFTARYAGGELRPDPAELEDARWFSLDDLPRLPPPQSIARRLIDARREGRARVTG